MHIVSKIFWVGVDGRRKVLIVAASSRKVAGVDSSSHAVASSSVQIVREVLHGIRENLRQGQEFDEIVDDLGNDHPGQRGYILGNLLVMEFLEDGRTLLAFAAFIGKGDQVESISRCIRLQVRLITRRRLDGRPP